MGKKRLDQILVERDLTESREKAQRLILAYKVKVDSQYVTKVGTKVFDDSKIEIEKGEEFVGKGAKKIESAYKNFNLNFRGKIIADIGASTGGFTDFALKNGARKVYAVDVGYGQLDFSLRNNPHVINMERTDIRNVEKFPEKMDIFLIDVSFISLKKILPKIKELINGQNYKAEIIPLIKPQFEVGKKIADRFKGVIKDEKIQKQVVKDIEIFAESENFAVISETRAGVLGKKGNQEYFLYLRYPKKVMAFGTFDLLHPGHKYFLEKASKFGKLKIVIPRDERVYELKKRKPVHSADERKESLKKLGYEAEIEKENPWQNVLDTQVDIIVLGYDQNWEREIKKEMKKSNYLVRIIKIKKAYKSENLKTSFLRKNLTS